MIIDSISNIYHLFILQLNNQYQGDIYVYRTIHNQKSAITEAMKDRQMPLLVCDSITRTDRILEDRMLRNISMSKELVPIMPYDFRNTDRKAFGPALINQYQRLLEKTDFVSNAYPLSTPDSHKFDDSWKVKEESTLSVARHMTGKDKAKRKIRNAATKNARKNNRRK